MRKLIIVFALMFVVTVAHADCWKVQATIKLNFQAIKMENYLNNKVDMEGIHLNGTNKELSIITRDGKVLIINMFFDTKTKAQAVYNVITAQSVINDMLDLDEGKSTVKLLNTTNDIGMATRRKGDTCISSYTKP